MATVQSDNSGMGVILGILLAVVLAFAGYFFFLREGGDAGTTVNLPDVNIEAPATPAPAQ